MQFNARQEYVLLELRVTLKKGLTETMSYNVMAVLLKTVLLNPSVLYPEIFSLAVGVRSKKRGFMMFDKT